MEETEFSVAAVKKKQPSSESIVNILFMVHSTHDQRYNLLVRQYPTERHASPIRSNTSGINGLRVNRCVLQTKPVTRPK